MTETVALGGALHPLESSHAAARPQPELQEWLRTGRLTLMDKERRAVDVEQWDDLPAETRAAALADFRRVVRANAKAVVLFLK